MRDRLTDQQLGLGAGALDAEDRDERRLAGGGIGADRLAGLGSRAFDIEQIVGDLEGEAEIVRVTAQCSARTPTGALARIAPASHENAIKAPVFIRCSRVIAPMSSA